MINLLDAPAVVAQDYFEQEIKVGDLLVYPAARAHLSG
jgi:hypothetical protein